MHCNLGVCILKVIEKGRACGSITMINNYKQIEKWRICLHSKVLDKAGMAKDLERYMFLQLIQKNKGCQRTQDHEASNIHLHIYTLLLWTLFAHK